MTASEAVAERPRSYLAKTGGPGELRKLAWEAQRAMWRTAKDKRHAYCRRVPLADFVGIVKHGDRASYSWLQTCGSMVCPLCGPRIAVQRAADISLAIAAHYLAGGRVAFVTYTLPHKRGQRLSDLLRCLARAYRAAGYNKGPKRLLRLYSAGQIRRLEVTVGPNGWHPHLHELLFLEAGVSDDQAHDLAEARYRALTGSLERQGLGKSSRRGYSFEMLGIDAAQERVAEYAAKSASHELASAGTKWGRGENRTPNQLLDGIARHQASEAQDVGLWREYEAAMKGKRVIVWSAGLRDRLLGDELPELDDRAAADAPDGPSRLIAAIGPDTWKRISRSRIGPAAVLQWAEVYDDDHQAADLIARQLARHELGQLEAGSSPAQGQPTGAVDAPP